AFPTHIKLSPPQGKNIDAFILNGAECEPFLTADHRLMLEKPQEIIKGMRLVMKALGVNKGYAAVEKNKPDAIAALRQLADGRDIQVVELESFYPQGAEKQLIKTILRREVPPGGLPYDVGAVVQNAATCFAVYEAIYNNKPLYEKVITVTGGIVKSPGNFRVRVGARIREVIAACGGLSEKPSKVILGGPMMGIAQWTLDVPIIKGTSAILIFGKKESRERVSEPCIRCGRCIQVCPMRLNPSQISQAAAKDRFDLAREYNVLDCVECGICAYVCPGKRDIVELVKLAKQKLK
ncbi:MAG: RnfABCDGE type electron transport complex subunit C, partial [Candidatus Omnitrophota bacterium]